MNSKAYASTRYLPFGDNAILIELGDTIDQELNRKVLCLSEAIEKTEIAGIEEVVPTYRSLLVRYNPLKVTYEKLVFQIKDVEKMLQSTNTKTETKTVIVPVSYGEEYGLDLTFVARFHKLTVERVIELHSGRMYRVYMIGFVAGFPYLGEVPDEIATPRLETPRLKVPAGSVGIAEKQTGIYPCEAPGGWRIIGRTPLKLFNPYNQPPALIKPSDNVKFKPISKEEFEKIRQNKQ